MALPSLRPDRKEGKRKGEGTNPEAIVNQGMLPTPATKIGHGLKWLVMKGNLWIRDSASHSGCGNPLGTNLFRQVISRFLQSVGSAILRRPIHLVIMLMM